MKPLLLFLIVIFAFISVAHADDDDDATIAMVAKLSNDFGADQVAKQLPCLVNTACYNCTSYFGCVWVTKSTSNGITVTQGGSLLYSFPNVRFCWTGGFAGGYLKEVFLGGATVDATFGWNDYTYQQCQVRGGVAILLIVFSCIGAVCASYCFIFCCVVFFGNQCRKKKNAYYKQKDDN
jgi:hypothetical protein